MPEARRLQAAEAFWNEEDGVEQQVEAMALLARHLKLHELFASGAGNDIVTSRRLVLGNGDVRISYVVAGESSPLYRNAIGDECVYVEAGSATVETMFGALTVSFDSQVSMTSSEFSVTASTCAVVAGNRPVL